MTPDEPSVSSIRSLRGIGSVGVVIATSVLLLSIVASAGTLRPESNPPGEPPGTAAGTNLRFADAVAQAPSHRSPTSGGANTVIGTISGLSSPFQGTFDPRNGYLYFPDSSLGPLAGDNSSNLTVISGASQSVVDQVFLGVYSAVQTPTYVPSNAEVYVPNQNATGFSNNVTALNSGDQIVANIDTGNSTSPTTGVYDPTNQYLYVSDQTTANLTALNDNVTVIDTATNSEITQILVGLDPTPGVYDPADGDVYVPNSDVSETNVSVINTSTDTVIATIGGFASPITPVYDPVNEEVYVPNSEGLNVTVLKGTSVVGFLKTGFGPATPAVDPATGEIYVPNYADNNLLVFSPESGALIATIDGGATDLLSETPTFDPINDEIYMPAENPDETSGFMDAIDTATNTILAAIGVGSSPQTPTFDPDNYDLYVPSYDDNNVSVINAGPVSTVSPPGSYPVTFTETGLNNGTYWNVLLNGTILNRTVPTITFDGIYNGTYGYVLGPWGDENECGLNEPSIYGNVTVAGRPANVAVSFQCSHASASSSGILGLPGVDGYLLVGGIAGVAVVAAAVILLLRSRGPRGGIPAPPPETWTPPSPPPQS